MLNIIELLKLFFYGFSPKIFIIKAKIKAKIKTKSKTKKIQKKLRNTKKTK